MDYQDSEIAAIYELANPLAQDTEFYLTLAGVQSCKVLDLGCGTGTLCCSLAERGHRVTGVEPAAAMLAVARSKPYAERVQWVESSAQTYRSRQSFDLIFMTGHGFQVLLSDADALAVLATMQQHLKTGGRIAFETRNPRMDWVSEWAAQSRMLAGGQISETLKITGVDGEFISFQTSYRVSDRTLTTNSTLRFPSREHLEALITRAGLVIRNLFRRLESWPVRGRSIPGDDLRRGDARIVCAVLSGCNQGYFTLDPCRGDLNASLTITQLCAVCSRVLGF